MHLTDLPASPAWDGINHLALITNDMDATVRFYAGVLGMPLTITLRANDVRHYFFRIGPHATIAFFEFEDAQTFQRATMRTESFPVQLDHISVNVGSEEALDDLAARLRAAGSEVTETVDHGVVRSIYFTDNNGIALEASWWAIDPVDGDHAVRFQDHDPVQAVADLDAGELGDPPRTQLVG